MDRQRSIWKHYIMLKFGVVVLPPCPIAVIVLINISKTKDETFPRCCDNWILEETQ